MVVAYSEPSQTTNYSVSLRIQSECGKMRTTVIPTTDTFHAMV